MNINELSDDDLFELLDNIDYDNLDIENKEKYSTINFCKTCNIEDYIIEDYINGIVVCGNCGDVVATTIDYNPEWRQFEDDGQPGVARCSAPINHFLPQSSLGTSISGNNRTKLKILHNWSKMPYKERSLNIVLKEIQSKCEKANILKCIEHDAKILYHNISECKHLAGLNKGKFIIIRGKNRRSLIAACVFFACKRKQHTRSIKEIAELFSLKNTEITKGCKTFIKLMKIKKMAYDCNTSSPADFIPRYCKELNINKFYMEKALQIVKNVQMIGIATAHTPPSTAASAILIMAETCNLSINKKSVAKKFGVSEVTIGKAMDKFNKYKKIILDSEMAILCAKKMLERKQTIKMPVHLIEKFKKIGVDVTVEQNKNKIIDMDVFDSDECIFEIEDDIVEYDMFDFDNQDNDLDEYIDYINLDIYSSIANTNSEYEFIIKKKLIS